MRTRECLYHASSKSVVSISHVGNTLATPFAWSYVHVVSSKLSYVFPKCNEIRGHNQSGFHLVSQPTLEN